MKKATGFILLIAFLFLLAGCAGEKLPEVTIDEILKYNETGYNISQIQWLNNEEIFLKTGRQNPGYTGFDTISPV